ncbi:DUF4386 domain-containing protein [Flagellimonas sp.]|uniref:DUF4386 domain-containing protein n=1 Tax=Flagellimonas sp. TaxID=2058762 RepID=UPI003F4A2989
MKNFITKLSTNTAAIIVGIAFISSIIFVVLVDDFLLANFVVPGDIEVLVKDIKASKKLFRYAVMGYMVVLVLDCIIGLSLYVVLKPANKKLAWYTAALRLLYAGLLMIGLFALFFQIIDAYGYESIKLLGYLFFAAHILVLGYSVVKSVYIPKSLGILLLLASLAYIVFFVDLHLPESFNVMVMLTMLIAELSLSVWLIVKRNRLPES